MTAPRFNYALYDLISAIDEAPCPDSVGATFVNWCRNQGAVVVHTFYGPDIAQQHVSTLPSWEVEATCDLVKDGTNRVTRLISEGTPCVFWGTELNHRASGVSKQDENVADMRRDHFNQRSSVTFAMPGADGKCRGGGIGIGFDEDETEFEHRFAVSGAALTMASHYAYANMTRAFRPLNSSPLSKRQTEILQYLASGHRIRVIAEKLGITESAVTLYLHNLRNKLGASTKEQALSIAIRNGWLEP